MANVMVVLVVAATALIPVSAAETYIVGDSLGWAIPPGAVVAYSDWASKHNFMAGDILVFNFTKGHSVGTVSKDDFDACNTDNPLSVKQDSPANYTLASGDTYFICLVDQHCVQGQQLAVTAAPAAGSPTSNTAPRPSAGTNAPPPPPMQDSSATRAIAASFLISMSLLIAELLLA